jgi:putative transposase
VRQCKRQLKDGASEVFTRGKKTKGKDEGQTKEAEMFEQIERLQMEQEWHQKSFCCSDADVCQMSIRLTGGVNQVDR